VPVEDAQGRVVRSARRSRGEWKQAKQGCCINAPACSKHANKRAQCYQDRQGCPDAGTTAPDDRVQAFTLVCIHDVFVCAAYVAVCAAACTWRYAAMLDELSEPGCWHHSVAGTHITSAADSPYAGGTVSAAGTYSAGTHISFAAGPPTLLAPTSHLLPAPALLAPTAHSLLAHPPSWHSHPTCCWHPPCWYPHPICC
jgi:hypothetical protein